jgi:hypothetical protein
VAGAFGFTAYALTDDDSGPKDEHTAPAGQPPASGEGIQLGKATLQASEAGVELDTSLTLRLDQQPEVAPELHFDGYNGRWLIGIDVANNGGGRDFVLAASRDLKTNAVSDIIYLAPEEHGVTVGIGRTPPRPSHRLQVQGNDRMGGLAIFRPEQGGASPFAILDTNGHEHVGIDHEYSFFGLRARARDDGPALVIARRGGGASFSFGFKDDSLRVTCDQNGAPSFDISSDGRFTPVTVPDFSQSGLEIPHVGTETPKGGRSGELRIGKGRLWVNDDGDWREIKTS